MGDLDGGVRVVVEDGVRLRVLTAGQQRGPGQQHSPDAAERLTGRATVAAGVLLDPLAAARELLGREVDVLGLVLSLAGIVTLVWSIIEGPRNGWLSPVTLCAFAGALALLTAFVWREIRAENPVFDVTLFRNRRFSLPALSITVAYFSMFGFLFLITQYFQGIQEYSPLEFGIRSLPFAAAVLIAAPAATMLALRNDTAPLDHVHSQLTTLLAAKTG
ncbi:hypothetical protein GCM10023353_34940 [Tomitella cavernea]|uniref:MFS transporter n=1 Tax=Tomitella cavernea TaxID=1387982 RepID=A0ABP9D5A9_9ACTN